MSSIVWFLPVPGKSSDKHAPKHRGLRARIARASVRTGLVAAGVAMVATGVAVSGGVLADSAPVDSAAAALTAHRDSGLSQAELDERQDRTSRSSDRTLGTDRRKARALSVDAGKAVTRTADLTSADPKTLARALLPQYGMSSSQFGCLDNIWSQESGWNVHADNPASSAYGIPQALPGSKMASAGPNWQSNPETQIRWGLGYIRDRYGSACAAWGFKQGHGWY